MLTVVDPDSERLAPWQGRVNTVIGEGIAFMTDSLSSGPLPDWIVPAAPIHVAYEWILETVTGVRLETLSIPEDLAAGLPNPVPGKGGALYVSFADFLCPEDCPEPADRCTVTGRPRKAPLYRRLEACGGSHGPVIVVRSHQLGPGVGGYAPDALFEVKRRIERMEGMFLLGTACRCHGVLHALRATPSALDS